MPFNSQNNMPEKHITIHQKFKKFFGIVFFIVILGSGFSVRGAERFFYEDFEDKNFRDSFVSTYPEYCGVWKKSLSITSNSVASGSFCLRYQASMAYKDPVDNIIGNKNSRINIGELKPFNEACGVYTDFKSHYSDEFAVRFQIRYDTNFDFYDNCKKILRIKGTKWGGNGLATWPQWENFVNVYMGDEFFSKSNPVTMYIPYAPPKGMWITILVHMNFIKDTILFRAVDSSGVHDIYSGPYYSTEGRGYRGARPTYITLVGAQCGPGSGRNRGIQIDNIEIWNGMPE